MPDEKDPAAPDGDVRKSVGRNAAISFLGTLASRLLGMVREVLIAATFAPPITDVFFVAWRIPNALRALLAEGAASAALGPVFSEALVPAKEGDPPNHARLKQVLARVGAAALLLLAVATLLGVLFARPIFALVSKRFTGDVARFELGVTLLRILFPFLFLMGWFSLGKTALERLNDFKPGASAAVMQNVAFVLAPFVMVPFARPLGVAPITMMAWAALLGGLLQVLWIRPALKRRDLLPRPEFARDPALGKVGRTFVTMLFGAAVYQVNVILSVRLLAALEAGSASWNSYAQRLADIPQGLFTVSLAGAAAAAMERDAARGDRVGVANTWESALKMSAFVAVPASVLLAAYADAVVPLVFGYGRFISGPEGSRNALEVARSLKWQALGVAAFAFVHPTNRVFAAFSKRVPIVTAACFAMVSFVISGPLLAKVYGHVGVAMASSLSGVVQLTVLLALVRKELPTARLAHVAPSLARVLGATGAASLGAWAALRYLPVTETTLVGRALAVFCGAALLLLYLGSAYVLRCEEMTTLEQKLRKRLRR